MTRPDPVVRATLACLGRPGRVLAGALVVGAAALLLAARLELRTSIAELLPTDDPAVQGLERTKSRVSDLSLLLIGIQSPDRAANLRYAAALTDHLQRLPPGVVEMAVHHMRDLQVFFEKNRWLYPSTEDLETVRDRLRTTILRHKNPLLVSFDEKEEGDDEGDEGTKAPAGSGEVEGEVEGEGDAEESSAGQRSGGDRVAAEENAAAQSPGGRVGAGEGSAPGERRPRGAARDREGFGRLLAAAQTQQGAFERRFPGGYFVRGGYAWVATLPAGGMVVENAGGPLIEAVRAFVAAHPPERFHPQMVVQAAGPVQSALQNREAVERDILSVTGICVVIIGLSIAVYFGRKRWLVVVVAPAAFGTLLAFALAEVTIGYLNSSTAFLGSIILGNGINHAIVLAARYRERRRAHREPPAAALAAAVAGVWPSTLAAALASAAVHASLVLTSFRGFSQFGHMGAMGSLCCWVSTFALMPALIAIVERRLPPPRPGPRDAPRPATGTATAPAPGRRTPATGTAAAPAPGRRTPLIWLADLVARQPRPILLASLAVTVIASLGFRHFLDAPFEYDFRKLSTDSDHDDQYRRFDQNLDALFDSWYSPTVLVADRLDQVEALRRAIRRQDEPAQPYIGRVVTVYNVLPGTPDEQRRKLAVLAEIRKLASDPAIALLDEEDQRLLRENLPPAGLRELLPGDLPLIARRPFTERDGTVGRVLLAYHATPRVSMWNGRDLLGISSVLERLQLDDGTIVESSGPPMIFGAMLRSILRDGPLATALSLLGVVLVLALFGRPLSAAAMSLGGLLLGVFWMVGAAGHLGVRVTFLNFIALPITFGIGVEYAVNVVARLHQESSARAAVLTTGGAVALCSFTTIVGYGSLLAAHSRALRGFGALAILGEVACLACAVLVLPALFAWRRSR